ncbi:MAG: YcnI family protein [Ramlibacter sp.]|nr:YcnI family protein [Ramlibacter sp.]
MTSSAIKTVAKHALWFWATGFFGLANAHVVLEYQVAPAASSYKATFKVGHGCGASPTRQIVVEIPAGMRGARPMPKPGWTLAIERGPLAQPYTSHGRTVTEDVQRISWTARTPDDVLDSAHYDEFVLVAQTPAQVGPVYWPVRQLCAEGRNDWTEVPRPGQALSDLKTPAAQLDILPGAGAAAHQH